MHNLIVTDGIFVSQRWQQALTDPVIMQTSEAMVGAPSPDALIWVLAGIANWQACVTHFAKQGHITVVLSRYARFSELQLALNAGARGYLDALANPQTLRTAEKTLRAGALWIPAEWLSGMLGALSQSFAPSISDNRLSAREQAVADAVLEGKTNKEIAIKLAITERTVKHHLTQIFHKLQIRDRMQLILKLRAPSAGD